MVDPSVHEIVGQEALAHMDGTWNYVIVCKCAETFQNRTPLSTEDAAKTEAQRLYESHLH